MDTPEIILTRAQRLAHDQQLPYRGALYPTDAWVVLQATPGARLIDVRTQAEWQWVGHVPGSLGIEWSTWPAGQRNALFAETLQQEVPDKATLLLFMCRSGVRSNGAATLAAELGYENVYNVLEGFEGDKDDDDHRNTIGGWRFHGLPWRQS